jgi:predicted RNase H-like nuclease (RuvC/YqgF family)
MNNNNNNNNMINDLKHQIEQLKATNICLQHKYDSMLDNCMSATQKVNELQHINSNLSTGYNNLEKKYKSDQKDYKMLLNKVSNMKQNDFNKVLAIAFKLASKKCSEFDMDEKDHIKGYNELQNAYDSLQTKYTTLLELTCDKTEKNK